MKRLKLIEERIDEQIARLQRDTLSPDAEYATTQDLLELYDELERIRDRHYCVICCRQHLSEEGCTHHAIDGAIG